uniref:Metalloendopeptidase n=1 Tax=Esox lucius TaxID=8010 RepID=A0A3P9AK59_ESOLU
HFLAQYFSTKVVLITPGRSANVENRTRQVSAKLSHHAISLVEFTCFLGQKPDEPLVMFGDIIVDPQVRNADPCTANDCKWPKSSDGKVYVPYVISNQYSTQKKSTIECGLRSFHTKTCIRFVPRTNQQDFLNITSLSGCYSSVGRRGNGQVLSLNRDGCVYFSVVQHEILHALGFHHEHTRRDRDGHVKILEKNIEPGKEHNFEKHNTINLQTPYDYNSIMHYKRCAFSVNGQPTILPIPDNNVAIGFATQMSPNDILRINRLYKCHRCHFKIVINHKSCQN